MRFRATLASLLTVILLSVLSVTLSCEIKCDVATLTPSCHGSESVLQTQHDSMGDMPGMAQSSATSSSVAEVPVVVAQAPICRTHDCVQQPSLLVEQRVVIAHGPSMLEAVVPAGLHFVLEPTLTEFLGRGPPPYRPATPVSLRTTLRI